MEILGIIFTILSHIIAPLYMSELKYNKLITALCWLGYALIAVGVIFLQQSVVIGFFVMLFTQLIVFVLTAKGTLGEKLFLFLTYSNSFCVALGVNIYFSTIPVKFMQTPFVMGVIMILIHLFLYKYLIPKFKRARAHISHGFVRLNIILVLFLIQFVNQYAFMEANWETVKNSILSFSIFSCMLYLTIVVLFMTVEDSAQKNQKAIENDSLKQAVFVDSLTQLKNRGGYDAYLKKIAAKYKKFPNGTCLLTIIDVDKFKVINDNKGHIEGDKVLSNLSRIMKEIFEFSDSELFRIGGDEFAIVSECLSAMELEMYVNDLNARLSEELNVSVSFGCAVVDFKDSKPFEVAFKSADQMMYSRKQQKRNTEN